MTTTTLRTASPEASNEWLATMAKALGHPARVAILRILSSRVCVCGEIVEELPLAQSTVSQHLKVLKEAGWIRGAIDGPRTCFSLNHEAIGSLRLVLGPLLEGWASAADRSGDSSCC